MLPRINRYAALLALLSLTACQNPQPETACMDTKAQNVDEAQTQALGRRSGKMVMQDKELARALDARLKKDTALKHHSIMTLGVFDKTIYLMGVVDQAPLRQQVEKTIKAYFQDEKPRKIVNELQVVDRLEPYHRTQSWPVTVIKTSFLTDTSLTTSGIQVFFINEKVYLIGRCKANEKTRIIDKAKELDWPVVAHLIATE